MNQYKSKDPKRMKQYQVMIDLARDPHSTLYNRDGSQNRAASHKAAFWNGYTYGMDSKFSNVVPHNSSIIYCVFRAGIDFKAAEDRWKAECQRSGGPALPLSDEEFRHGLEDW